MPTLGGPPVAPSVRSWLGVARELTAGTAQLPVSTIPMDAKSYSPEDTPKFLPDEAIRGSMAMLYNEILGPEDATFSFGGPNFLDTHGYFLDNIFGDVSTTGTQPLNGTTLSGSVATLAIGGTQLTVQTATGYAAGSAVQIDTGSITEVVTLANVAGTLLTFNYPLRFPHSPGATVNTVGPLFTHKFALLNSAIGYGGATGAQPPTHTLTDNTTLNYAGTPGTNTTGARAYPFACLSAMDFTGNAEQLLDIKVSGNSFVSQPASATPTNTVSSVIPVANWRGQVYIGGTAASNQIFDLGEWSLSLKRTLQVYWTVQGTPNPFVIARGPLGATLGMNFTTPADETPLVQYLLTPGYQYIHIVLDSIGLPGSEMRLTVDAHNCQTVKAKPGRSAVLFDFSNTFEAVSTASDSGGSGGLGPCTVTLINSVANY